MVRSNVQGAPGARRKCPVFGVFCFLCALVSSIFGTKSASADAPVAAIRASSLAAPAAVLGITNPYVVAAAAKSLPSAGKAPKIQGFTFSRDLRDLAHRVEKLARHGVDLNQRKLPHAEKLNLRVQSKMGGGVLQICYRR